MNVKNNFKDIEILGIRLSSTNLSLNTKDQQMQCLSYMMNFTENYFCIICGDLNSDINKAQKSERAGTLYNKYLIGVSLTQLSYQDEKNRCIHLEISLIDYILIPDFARFNSSNVMIENSVPFEVSDHLPLFTTLTCEIFAALHSRSFPKLKWKKTTNYVPNGI